MSSTRAPRANAPKLWHWMHQWGVTLEQLAAELGISPVYLGQLRRGQGRPSDELKERIATETKAIEEKRGVAEPRGVPVLDWFNAA